MIYRIELYGWTGKLLRSSFHVCPSRSVEIQNAAILGKVWDLLHAFKYARVAKLKIPGGPTEKKPVVFFQGGTASAKL